MVELGIPKNEKQAKSNPLLKETNDIPPNDVEIKIMRIAYFVSESVMIFFYKCDAC